MKRSALSLLIAAGALLIASLAFVLWPKSAVGTPSEPPGDHSDTIVNLPNAASVKFVTPEGAFEISLADGGESYLFDGAAEGYSQRELQTTFDCARVLGFAEALGKAENLAEWGLQNPAVTVTVGGVTYSVGDPTPTGSGYYLLRDDRLYIIGTDEGDQLTLPPSAYHSLSLWPDESGQRPAYLTLELSKHGETLYSLKKIEDAPVGSAYKLTYPAEIFALDAALRDTLLSCLASVDFDMTDGELSGEAEYKLRITAENFEVTLLIYGETAQGYRYVGKEGDSRRYVDKMGDYSFLTLTPLDFVRTITYRQISYADAETVTIQSPGAEHILDCADYLFDGAVIPEIYARRLFEKVLNPSVSEVFSGELGESVLKVTVDGSVLEFFATENARLLAVGMDGNAPYFCSNVKDALDILNYINEVILQ